MSFLRYQHLERLGKKWQVTRQIFGQISYIVEAETEEEALEMDWDLDSDSFDMEYDTHDEMAEEIE